MKNLFRNIGRFLEVAGKIVVLEKVADRLREDPDPVAVSVFLSDFKKLVVELKDLK